MIRGRRREVRKRIVAFDTTLVEEQRAGCTEDDRAMLRRANEEPPDVRMVAQRRDEIWMALVQFLEREPAPFLHEVDQAQVAGPEHDRVSPGDIVLRRLLLAAGRPRNGVRRHRALLVAAGDARDLPTVRQRPFDELIEPVAIALLEGGPLCLP